LNEDAEHRWWCRMQMNMLAHGGVWGVPRSGLIFQKTAADTLTLIERFPNDEPGWREYQDEELDLIRSKFEDAGFRVVDTT
jgi:hypothetical protein